MCMKLVQDVSIGKNLKALRERNHLTQEQAAAQLQVNGINVSREILSQMENGRYNVRISALLVMKSIYHVESFDEFFSGLAR